MEEQGVRTCNCCGKSAVVYLSDKGNYWYDPCKCEEEWWEENTEPVVPGESFLPEPDAAAKAVAAYEKMVAENPEEWNYPAPDDDDYQKLPLDFFDY